MLFADHALVKRLERVHAAGIARNVDSFHRLFPDERYGHLSIAGGHSFFADLDPSICRAMGMGFNEVVTAEDLDTVESFFHGFDLPSQVVLCPFTDESLVKLVPERFYTVRSFNQSLVKEITADEAFPLPAKGVVVRLAEPEEDSVWADTICKGFGAGGVPLNLSVGLALFHEPVSENWIAFHDGQPAGAAALDLDEGCAICTVGSVKEEFRRRGVHTALITARLASAVRHQCDCAIMLTDPGTISQRNAQKLGFQVVYSRVVVERV